MGDRYCWSGGTPTAPYESWATAANDPATAINAAAAGETVYIHDEDYAMTANVVITLAGTAGSPVTVLVSNDTTNAPPQTLGGRAHYTQTSTSYDLSFNGIGYVRGLGHILSGSTSLAVQINIGTTDNDVVIFEDAQITLSGTSSISSQVRCGSDTEAASLVIFRNCDIALPNTAAAAYFANYCHVIYENCRISSTASPTSIFRTSGRSGRGTVLNCDFTGITGGGGTLVNGVAIAVPVNYTFINCSFPSGMTLFGSTGLIAEAEASFYNCAVGDQHYNFEHYNFFGQTTVVTSPYANDGALYDGTNHATWKIVTTANASFALPYVSPWLEKYHNGTSAITPYLEIMRDEASAAAYTDAEVWAEFSISANTGSVLQTVKSDAKDWLDTTPNNQDTSSKTASDWTGETNGTAWFGKLVAPSATTPAEIGMLRARVCVGKPSTTIYVDPKIRT